MNRSLTIICNFNGKDLLRKCLDSLKPELGETDDVLVVDNGSSDGSADFIKNDFPWVRLLELPKNLGFTGGNNAALHYKDHYEYFVLLNNDTEVEPGFLEALLGPFNDDKNPPQPFLDRIQDGLFAKGGSTSPFAKGEDRQGRGISSNVKVIRQLAESNVAPIGITNAVILDGDGKTVDHAGGKWLSFLSGTNVGDYRGTSLNDLPTQPFETTYASGAALAIRTSLLGDGLFPDFFAYYEDVDLSWRVRNAGYSIIVIPQARVRHLGSATSGKNRSLFEFYAARNRVWLFRRNLPVWQKPIVLPILIVARLLLLLSSIGNWAILKARASGLWTGMVEEPAS